MDVVLCGILLLSTYRFYAKMKNKKGVQCMNKVKITVLKTTLDRELAAEYGVEGLTACPMLQGAGVLCGLCKA